MHPWAQVILVVCAVLLTGALVSALLAARRAAVRTERVLEIVEQELRPLIAQMHALTDDARALTREASLEVKRVGETVERVNTIAEGVGRVVSALAGLTRIGQLVGLAAGLRRGVDVFVQRLRKDEG